MGHAALLLPSFFCVDNGGIGGEKAGLAGSDQDTWMMRNETVGEANWNIDWSGLAQGVKRDETG